jgi:hypothetical protein
MHALERINIAYEAATKGEWQRAPGGDYLIIAPKKEGHQQHIAKCFSQHGETDYGHKEVGANVEFLILAHKLTPALLEAGALVAQARRLIAEAMDTHIYNEADGEAPAEDCAYAKFLKDADQLAEKFNVSYQ